MHRTDDVRIKWTKVVLPPVFLEKEMPMTERASSTIFQARTEISRILQGRDCRLLVVVGPCSIHDTKAAREYATLLKAVVDDLSTDPRIVMRVYFEKPRTTVGWKGLINDPHLDQSFKINDGLRPGMRSAEASYAARTSGKTKLSFSTRRKHSPIGTICGFPHPFTQTSWKQCRLTTDLSPFVPSKRRLPFRSAEACLTCSAGRSSRDGIG
jgi:hypothetical protein